MKRYDSLRELLGDKARLKNMAMGVFEELLESSLLGSFLQDLNSDTVVVRMVAKILTPLNCLEQPSRERRLAEQRLLREIRREINKIVVDLERRGFLASLALTGERLQFGFSDLALKGSDPSSWLQSKTLDPGQEPLQARNRFAGLEAGIVTTVGGARFDQFSLDFSELLSPDPGTRAAVAPGAEEVGLSSAPEAEAASAPDLDLEGEERILVIGRQELLFEESQRKRIRYLKASATRTSAESAFFVRMVLRPPATCPSRNVLLHVRQAIAATNVSLVKDGSGAWELNPCPRVSSEVRAELETFLVSRKASEELRESRARQQEAEAERQKRV